MWRTLVNCANLIEASMWKGKLADNGIDSVILDEKVGSVYPLLTGAIPVRVQVREIDFIKAKRMVIDRGEDGSPLALEDLEAEALAHPHPDEHHLEKCPSCGGTDVSFYIDSDIGWIGRFLSKRIRRCDCGYEWK